jgi:hypothetical protein
MLSLLFDTFNSVSTHHSLTPRLNYFISRGNHNVAGFVTRFYHHCLGREPDTSGLNTWVNALIDGSLCGADVANGLVFSEEFINRNTSNEEFVRILYMAFFNREPDPPGYSGWINLLDSGISRQDILNGFIYSLEFENLCNSYGIVPYPA